MLFKRISVFLNKHSKIRIHRVNGVYSDYILELDDMEIRLPEDKLRDLYNAIEGVCNGNCKKKNERERNLN